MKHNKPILVNDDELTPFYRVLPDLLAYFSDGDEIVYKNCEFQISGDFMIIYQYINKTILPLKDLLSIQYPYKKFNETSNE